MSGVGKCGSFSDVGRYNRQGPFGFGGDMVRSVRLATGREAVEATAGLSFQQQWVGSPSWEAFG